MWGRILSIIQRTTVRDITTKAITSTTVRFTPWNVDPPCSMPKIMENRIQPTRSSNIADDITTVPISLRSRFKSIRILAITGRAEIERAVPTNSEKIRRSAPGPAPRKYGNSLAAANPNAKGMITPKKLTSRALLPWRKMLRKSISRPAVRRKNTTPIVVTVSKTIGRLPVEGNRNAYKSGLKWPKTVGPRRIPAMISPKTDGWSSFCITSPASLAVPNKAAKARNIVITSWGARWGIRVGLGDRAKLGWDCV
jgi:hypothetical protein